MEIEIEIEIESSPGNAMMEFPALRDLVVDSSRRRNVADVCRWTKISLASTAFHPTIGSQSNSAFIRYCGCTAGEEDTSDSVETRRVFHPRTRRIMCACLGKSLPRSRCGPPSIAKDFGR